MDGWAGDGRMRECISTYGPQTTSVLEQPTLDHHLHHQCHVLTSSALCRNALPGRGGPRGDPPPEGLRIVCHGLQDTCHGVSWGLRALVLPAHPQQAEEVRLSVHRWLLVRGRAGETLRVRLPPVFLRPLHPLRLLDSGQVRWGWPPGDPPVRPEGKAWELEKKQKKKRILSIL